MQDLGGLRESLGLKQEIDGGFKDEEAGVARETRARAEGVTRWEGPAGARDGGFEACL